MVGGMKEGGVVVPFSVFADRYTRKYGRPLSTSEQESLKVKGHMLSGRELAEFLFSGRIDTLTDVDMGAYDELHFSVPGVRQRGLYDEVMAMRKRQPVHTIFSTKKDSSGHLCEVVGFGQGEDPNDLFVARVMVGRGRRVTDVVYGYFERPSNMVDFPHHPKVASIESIRRARAIGTQLVPTPAR